MSKGLSNTGGNRWQIILPIFHSTLRIPFKKLFGNNCGVFGGVVLSTLIPNAPYPGDRRFAFLTRSFLHYYCKTFSFLYASLQTLLQEFLRLRKLGSKHL